MSWTSENYQTVRDHLQPVDREVFDRMAYEGLRRGEAGEGLAADRLCRAWARACAKAGVEHVPSHRLRLDYIASIKK